jgi:hypothetical protein
MNDIIWLALGLATLGFLARRAQRVWVDAGQRGFDPARRAGWALLGAVVPSRYWWGARIETLSPQERSGLLARETGTLGLSRTDSLHCPLCGAEVPHAWALTSDGRPTVAPGPVECPGCDFRLDACRHCAHFLPGSPHARVQYGWGSNDLTSGRCECYKVSQPVEQACSPDMARQLKARGWERIRAPRPIVDSFVPPDSCTAFKPDRNRLKAGGVRWPGARRVALLRLLAPPPVPETESPEELPSDDEQWLL